MTTEARTLPVVPDPFRWDAGQLRVAIGGAQGLFTTRLAGHAGTAIDLAQPDGGAVLAAEIGVGGVRVATGRQEHGTRVHVVAGDAEPEPATAADAQATALCGVACAVRGADCLPVLIARDDAIVAVHAGWRGLAGGVVQAALGVLRELGDGPLTAALGPCARVCCYEVGAEVQAALAPHGQPARRAGHADLPGVARAILERAGAGPVHDCGLCTICAPDELFWSHRVEVAAHALRLDAAR
jgi:hypothetical protein